MRRRRLDALRRRTARFAIALAAAVAWPALAQVPQPPPVPALPDHAVEIPEPPPPPPNDLIPDAMGYRIPAGATHRGDVYKMTTAASIEGTLEGDLWCWASSVRIPGTVRGDVNAFAGTVEITGTADDTVRAYAGEVFVGGKLAGELIVSGGLVTIGKDAVVVGRTKLFAKEVVLDGTVENDVTITGGIAHLSGTIKGDADITVDELDVAPTTRIEGDLRYFSRKPLDLEGKNIVGGAILYNQAAKTTIEIERDRDERRSSAARFGFFLVALLAGTVALALFRSFVPEVTRAVGEPVQCLGAGFLAALSPIAVTLTAILIITIPLVLLYWLLFLVAVYLAKVPIALWIGDRILGRLRGKESSRYGTYLVGLAVLAVLFAVPFVGKVLWIVTAWLGLGAIVIGVRNWRQARRSVASALPPPDSPAPAAPPMPPASPASAV